MKKDYYHSPFPICIDEVMMESPLVRIAYILQSASWISNQVK